MNYKEESLKKHYEWKGKIEVNARAKVDNKEALALAYTPGVAEPCLEIQKDYKKPVRYKKLKYLSYKLEDHYNKKIFCSSGIKEMPYEYQIKKNGKLYGTLIDEYGYPLKKYGQLGNGKKDGWYFGDSDKECWFKPKKVMKDVAAVHMGSGEIIVTRMDGSKWATGIGFGNERSESGKKVSTRFVMISK